MDYFDEILYLESTSSENITIDMLANQNFVLYFYPKDNTSGCTMEAIEFSELYDEFRELGFHVYGISKDSVKSHEKFKDKNNVPFHLISDPGKIMHERFDVVKQKKMYGKIVNGTERSTFVFTTGLELIKSFRNVKAKGHAKEVLNFIEDNILR